MQIFVVKPNTKSPPGRSRPRQAKFFEGVCHIVHKVVPPYLLTQSLRFQLFAVYSGPKKKRRKIKEINGS
jgi:hypothetical protein